MKKTRKNNKILHTQKYIKKKVSHKKIHKKNKFSYKQKGGRCDDINPNLNYSEKLADIKDRNFCISSEINYTLIFQFFKVLLINPQILSDDIDDIDDIDDRNNGLLSNFNINTYLNNVIPRIINKDNLPANENLPTIEEIRSLKKIIDRFSNYIVNFNSNIIVKIFLEIAEKTFYQIHNNFKDIFKPEYEGQRSPRDINNLDLLLFDQEIIHKILFNNLIPLFLFELSNVIEQLELPNKYGADEILPTLRILYNERNENFDKNIKYKTVLYMLKIIFKILTSIVIPVMLKVYRKARDERKATSIGVTYHFILCSLPVRFEDIDRATYQIINCIFNNLKTDKEFFDEFCFRLINTIINAGKNIGKPKLKTTPKPKNVLSGAFLIKNCKMTTTTSLFSNRQTAWALKKYLAANNLSEESKKIFDAIGQSVEKIPNEIKNETIRIITEMIEESIIKRKEAEENTKREAQIKEEEEMKSPGYVTQFFEKLNPTPYP